jgi:TRAP-type C4-dicarboxylate transport system permease small subunit
MKFLRALSHLLVRIETVLLVFFLSVMVVLAFGQVVLRNVFGTGVLWADPLVRQMVLWSGFLGAALATREDRHISVDAFTKFLSPGTKSLVKIVTSVAAAVAALFLAMAAWGFLQEEKTSGGEMFLGIPSWVGLLIVPAGYAVIMIHFLITAAERAVERFGRAGRERGGGRA